MLPRHSASQREFHTHLLLSEFFMHYFFVAVFFAQWFVYFWFTCRYSPYGLFGLPQKLDAFAKWDTTYYGGLRGPQEASNIVFSNGALDPWSTAGVVNNVSSSVVAVVLPEGGHHLDLFFPDPNDPPGAVQARQVETTAVNNWIQQFYKSRH